MKTSSLSRSLVLVALPALAGCRSEAPAQAPAPTTTTSPTPVAPTSGAPAPTGSAALDGSGAASQPRCAADADCVVSCARPEQCCDQLCPPCNQAFHRDALAAHKAWRARSCAAESCPVAKCMAPKEDSIARCSAGQCTVERVPRAEQ